MKRIFCLLVFILPSTGFADSFDMNFGDESFRFTYAWGVDNNLVGDLGLLYLEERGRGRDDEMGFHTGLNVTSGNVRFGGRAFLISPGDYDTLSVGFGGQGRFALSKHVGIGGHFYYAPEVTSFIDSKGYHEYRIHLDFKVARSAYLYLGYRNVKVRIEDRNNKVELDDDAMLGFKIYF